MKNLILLFGGALFALRASAATGPDSTIHISSAKDNYQIVYNSKTSRVEINQDQATTYVSEGYQATMPIAIMYNDQIKINSVSCKVDGHTPSDFKPYYGFYTVSDVFYSDAKVCLFPMLLKNKGSKGEVKVEETYNDPRYFTSISFSDEVDIAHKEITIKVPRWMSVDIKEFNFNGLDIKKTSVYLQNEDADLITYTAENLPAEKREDHSPGPTYLYPHLLIQCKSASVGGQKFTYFGSLADQYAWYHELTKDTYSDAEIKEKAKEITAKATTDLDKIKAVYYWVQDNIRYIAFENGIAGFKPEKPDEVLRKKYADCKGMANLTKALLISLGYDARLCWLGTNHIAYDYSTPSLAVDNHMICALMYKSKTYFLDATETYIGIDEYAERIQGRHILIEDGEKYILNHVPKALPGQNADNEVDKVTISGNDFVGKVTHLWQGEDKEDVLSGINSVKKENTDEVFTHFLAHFNNDYHVKNLNVSNLADQGSNLNASYDFEYKNAVSNFSKTYYIEFDKVKELNDAAIKTSERKHDYWFSHTINLNRETELTIPDNYKVAEMPQNLNIVNTDYEFHIQYVMQGNKLSYKKTLLIKNTHLNQAKFEQWNKDLEQLNKAYNETVVLKPLS
ncbi:transglutaminase-like domain-containing protein [Mucilaginibacter jinjuensis]|uniref:Transglutaminase-like domain-containing protein n=1 Tax=Mucilaginibacter jinjuensis TaxID=1176721 RepID=A0ABY7T0V8_9SPHI|nr:transglutaminase-like domain-containing protein [Mucilaginibacter jinjuensis]WCT10064.1 transglutaminase-like domain-containing protein [Mucilaginibacter jinjuensis]